MRGISPIIASVLLILLAVAAVGGAWVFVQRIQSSTTTSGSGQVETIREKASITISVDSMTLTDNGGSDDIMTIKLANAGGSTAKTTRIAVENDTGTVYLNSTTLSILSNTFADYLVVVPDAVDVKNFCASGFFVKVTVYSDAAIPIREYPVECKY